MRVARHTGDLLITTDAGLYCPEGRFHIDPWAPVDRAVTTHAPHPPDDRVFVIADNEVIAMPPARAGSRSSRR